jgi:peptide deformylase
MPILPICLYPEDHVLRQKSKKIRHIDSSIQQLIDNMTDTMQQAHGVGLAAS